MRSFFKLVLCSVLLGFSINMPAQNLPALQKDAAVTKGELANGISYYLVTNSAMKGVADFALVRKGLTDTLAAREELSSLPHFNKTIPYRFLSRKGIGCRSDGYISYRDDATVFRFDEVPMFDSAAADTTLLMLFDIIAAQPCKHAVIVAGDIKPSDIIEKMNVFALMVPSRNPSYKEPEYSWTPSEATSWSFDPSGKASLQVDFRSSRTPKDQMNTIQPFISQLFSMELAAVVGNRLRETFLSRNLSPHSVDVTRSGSSDSAGDEHFTVTVEAPGSQMIPVTMAVSSVLSGVGSKGVTLDEYKTVREPVLGRLSKVQTNDDLVRRCISAYLFGSDLSSPVTKVQFFSSRNMTLESEVALFNSYVSALLGSTENASVKWTGDLEDYDEWVYQMMFKSTWNGVASLEKPSYEWKVSSKDTTGFSGGNKTKLKSTATEPVSGGEMWTFANGMRVIYKKMGSGSRFSYSMMVKGGFATVRDLPRGEGAFFSDMMSLYNVAGLSGNDFDKVLKANGVEMETKVSASDMRIYGSAPKSKYPLVLKALLSMAGERKLDPAAFDSYRKMELASLEPAYLDSLMYPGYNYSEAKTPSGLTSRTQSDADAYFSDGFLRCNDGVIVLVGDLKSEDLQKYLSKCLGGFRVSKTAMPSRQGAAYRMRTGTTSYSREGTPVSISIGLAATEPFTTENYMAFRIAGMALQRRLSGAMAEQGFSVTMSHRFSTYPQEAMELIFNLTPVPDSGLPAGVAGGTGHPGKAVLVARKTIDEVFSKPIGAAELNSCKALLANAYSSSLADPGNYADAILMRYSSGKDVLTSYSDRINSVSADNVKGIFGALAGGMRIEYVVKPEE